MPVGDRLSSIIELNTEEDAMTEAAMTEAVIIDAVRTPLGKGRPGGALARSGLSLSDIDFFEVNEAFASVVLAWAREVGADLDKVNVRGGAIAFGHPLGASGARLMTSLLGTLEEPGARYGVQLMCEGGGMANATLIERIDR
jgi:acetyl-CoA acetyltransferase